MTNETENKNVLCKIDFEINHQPAIESDKWSRWQSELTKRVTAAGLRYSRPFTDEEQRKSFLQGVAFATRLICQLVIANARSSRKSRKSCAAQFGES